jgi:hypothetical protein
LGDEEQSLHVPPFKPQAVTEVPVTQVPLLQQPALHGCVALQEVLQVCVVGLQDVPTGQSMLELQPQEPATQARPELEPKQDLPQAPQLFASFEMLVSQPLAGFWSQSAKPALQARITHAPALQPVTALGKEQTRPQAPQLLGSVWVLTHVPLQIV